MFIDFSQTPPPPRRGGWTELPADEALLLWALRRLAVAWPGPPAVVAALHRRWGDAGVGVLHLLRCWLHALAGHAGRPLRIGDPACALLLDDEAAMLAVLRRPDARGLARLGADRGAAELLPLAAALAAATGAWSCPRSAPGSASAAASPASGSRVRSGRAG